MTASLLPFNATNQTQRTAALSSLSPHSRVLHTGCIAPYHCTVPLHRTGTTALCHCTVPLHRSHTNHLVVARRPHVLRLVGGS